MKPIPGGALAFVAVLLAALRTQSTADAAAPDETSTGGSVQQQGAAPPRSLAGQGVTNAAWLDTDTRWGFVGGVISWTPPAVTANVDSYQVWICGYSADDMADSPTGANIWDSELQDPLIPVGTNKMNIYSNTRRALNGNPLSWENSDPPARWFQVYASVNGQIQTRTELDDTAVIGIYDTPGNGPIIIPFDNSTVTFSDTDNRRGYIGGRVSWEIPPKYDFTHIQTFEVFLAIDELCNDPSSSWVVPGSSSAVVLPNDLLIGNRRFFCVVAHNTDDSHAPVVKMMIDDTGGLPTQGVTNLHFTDEDTDPGEISGLLTWDFEFVATASNLLVYLARDQSGSGRIPLCAACEALPRTKLELTVPADTDLVGRDYFVVYTKNEHGMQATPAFLLISDKTIGGPPAMSALVQSIEFSDQDSGFQQVDGTVRWTPGGESDVGSFVVCLGRSANAAIGDAGLTEVGEVSRGTYQVALGPMSILNDDGRPYNFILIFAKNQFGTAASANSITLEDNKTLCTDDVDPCPANSVYKAVLPGGCSTGVCTAEECCDVAGQCSSDPNASDSIVCSGDHVLKVPPPSSCTGFQCTKSDCCSQVSLPPGNVTISSPSPTSLQLAWEVPLFGDCTFLQYQIQWRRDADANAWQEVPAGCTLLNQACDSSCMASNLPSNTAVRFRARVQCALLMDNVFSVFNSSWSGESLPASTLLIPPASPTNLILSSYSDSSVFLSWLAPPSLGPDCTFADWLVELRDDSQNVDWTAQSACTGLALEGECDVLGLHCETSYSLRVAVKCAQPQLFGAFSSAKSFQTTKGQECFRAALAPSGVVASAPSTSAMNVSWTPGLAQDCIFAEWLVEVRPQNRATWSQAQGCEGLATRTTTSCTAIGLKSLTAHEFRVQEVCSDSSLTSDWHTSLFPPTATLVLPAAAPLGLTSLSPTFSSASLSWELPELNDCIFLGYVVQWRYDNASGAGAWRSASDASSCQRASVGAGASGQAWSVCSTGCTTEDLPSNTRLGFQVGVGCSNADAVSVWSSLAYATTPPRPMASPTGLSATVITEESSATVSWQAGLLFDCIFAGWTVERFDGAWEAQCEVTNISQTSCRLIDLPCSSRIQVRVFGRCQDPLANSGYSATKEFVTAPVGCVEIGSPPSSVNASMPTVSSLLVAWTAATASGNCNFTQWEVQSQPQTQASWVAAAGCEGLTTRGVTTCTATGLRSLTVHMFRVREVCGGNQSAGAWGYADLVSTLIMASAQPGSVVGSNPATHEMYLEWERPSLNDCVFKKYLLAWRKAGDFASQWATPEGCKDLVSACTSACTARGLPSNTSLEFRVALSCTPTEANSIWSNASAIVSTLPVPAAPPTGLLQGSIAASSATVSWQAGTLNDCLFRAWLVEVRDVSNGIPWTAQTSCAGQSYNGATCSITGLTCSSVIEVRVQAICADPLANSPVSVVTSFTTPGGDACLQRASPPSSVNASMPTVSSLLVSWAAATESQNCNFARWEVQIQLASWVAAAGCDGLTTRGMTTCSAAGLQSLTAHKFRVREVCQLSQTTGAWGESAVAVFTLAIPAAAPEGVTALSPSFRSMQVSWSPPKLNDCVFRSYVVEWRLLVSPSGWAEASCAGAAAATSGACDAGCQATGLPSRTALSFRARVLCSDEGTSSTWSSEAVATTLHRRAESPVAPAVLDVSIFSARVTWPLAGSPLASALHDCGGSEFLGWRVELQDASSGERWGAPPPHTASASDSDSCNATMPASAQGCNLTGLSCNTHYAVRLAPLCSQPEASPLLPGQEQNFSTLASQQCLRRASSPAGIVGLLPSFTGLQLSWVPGQANDCTFLAWDVKLYVSAPSESFLPQGCDGLSVRELASCFAAGLSDGTSYQISVQELCAESVLASPLGVSSLPATTLEVPAPEVLLQLPSPGEIVGQRPQALLMMFSVPVSAENIPRLSLCAVGAGCPQNGCQELGSDAASFSLKSSRLASWAANSSMWQQGCSYEVRLQAGSFETLAQPAKQQAEITWGFAYNATLPALLGPASLALAATEQLELVVAWTASVEFLCRARRSTGSTTSLGAPQLVALGVPATFQLQGLRPGSIYDIECQGSLQDDPSVTSSWLPAGRAATLQDSNADLSELKLLATPICPGGQQLESQVADATPAFDPNVTSYDVVLVSSDFLFACNLAGQETTTEAVWQLSLASTSQSSYAIVSETSWGASSSSSGGLRLLSLPVAEATVSLTGVVSVTSMAGPVRSYQVQVMALRLNFDVGIPKLTTVTGADVSLQPLEEGRSLEVQVNYSSSSALAAEVWSRLQIFLGPFPQTTLAIPVTGTTSGGGAQQYHLVVLAMLGVGRDLPLQLRLGDALVGQAPSMMSFVDPVVSCISSTGYGSCSAAALEAMEVILATVGETMIFVKGSGFGSHPMLAQAGPLAEQLLRLAVTRESSAVRSLELCADSAWASSSELWCRLLPQVAPPLSLALLGPTGRKLTTDGSGSAPAAAVANSWEVAPLIDLQWTAAYAPPVVSELSSMDLPLSGGGQLFIVGSGFPNFTSDLPRVQLQPGSQNSARLRRLQASGSDALCAPLVRVNDTHLFCNLSSFLNLSSWGCSSMDLEVVWGNLRSQLQAPALRVPKPQITTVTEVSPGPDGNVEIGTGSTFEVQGRGFGTDGNGPIVLKVGDVLCDVSARTDTRLFCSIDGPLRSDLLPFYPAAENHRSGAVEVAVEINITVILGGDSSAGRAGGSGNGGCEPVAATWTQHRVRLLPCPAGTRRSSKDTMACEACAAGRYTSADGPFLACAACPRGRFQPRSGSLDCLACPARSTTEGEATVQPSACECVPGAFLPKDLRGADAALSNCEACSSGAVCEGGLVPPRSLPGHWLLFDESSALICTLDGCLGNNSCAGGYKTDAKCETCDRSYYADLIVQACKQCPEWVSYVGLLYVLVGLWVMFCFFMPIISWKAKVALDPTQSHEVPWICFGVFERWLRPLLIGRLHRAVTAAEYVDIGFHEQQEGWPRTRRFLTRVRCIYHSPLRWLAQGAELQRVTNILLNNLQVLYLTSSIGYKFWPEEARDLLRLGSYVMTDAESLRMGCLVPSSAVTRWFLQWLLPYVLYACFCLAVRLRQPHRLRRRRITFMVSGACLLYLVPPHLLTLFQVFQCADSGDGRWTLEIDRSVICYGTQDETWNGMLALLVLDGVLLIILLLSLFSAGNKSYFWYRTAEIGSKPPSEVFFTWWWVTGCAGVSMKHRAAIQGLKVQLPMPTQNLSAPEVSTLCEDLFDNNLGTLKGGVGRLARDLKSFRIQDESGGRAQALTAAASMRHSMERLERAALASPKSPRWGRSGTALSVASSRSAQTSFFPRLLELVGWRPRAANVPQAWEIRCAARHQAYEELFLRIEHLVQQFRTMSSFSSEQAGLADYFSYQWEMVLLANKVAIGIIRMASVRSPERGLRAALVVTLFFTLMTIAVRPYRHPGLNAYDALFNTLTVLVLISLIMLERDPLNPESGMFNVLLLLIALFLALTLLFSWVFFHIWDLVFKDTFYVMVTKEIQGRAWRGPACRESDEGDVADSDFGSSVSCVVPADSPDGSDTKSGHAQTNGKGTSNGHATGCSRVPAKHVLACPAAVSTRVVRSRADLLPGEELAAQWFFCSPSQPQQENEESASTHKGLGASLRSWISSLVTHGNSSTPIEPLPLDQGVAFTVRDPEVLMRVLNARGGPVDLWHLSSGGQLPAGLQHLEEKMETEAASRGAPRPRLQLSLARGGDLTGQLQVRLPGGEPQQLKEALAELRALGTREEDDGCLGLLPLSNGGRAPGGTGPGRGGEESEALEQKARAAAKKIHFAGTADLDFSPGGGAMADAMTNTMTTIATAPIDPEAIISNILKPLSVPRVIGGRLVPAGAVLDAVRYVPHGTALRDAESQPPAAFLAKLGWKGRSVLGCLAGAAGDLVLEFRRPDVQEDIHQELCELILSRDEVPGEQLGLFGEEAEPTDSSPRPPRGGSSGEAGRGAEATSPSSFPSSPARPPLGLPEASLERAKALLQEVGDVVLPLDLRLVIPKPRLQLQVHSQPSWGCLEEVLVLERAGQQWLVQLNEIQHHLGNTSEVLAKERRKIQKKSSWLAEKSFASASSAVAEQLRSVSGEIRHLIEDDFQDIQKVFSGDLDEEEEEDDDSDDEELAPRIVNDPRCQGQFASRSAWRIPGGGVVMIHDFTCFGGRLELRGKPQDAQAVEHGERLGQQVLWHRPKEKASKARKLEESSDLQMPGEALAVPWREKAEGEGGEVSENTTGETGEAEAEAEEPEAEAALASPWAPKDKRLHEDSPITGWYDGRHIFWEPRRQFLTTAGRDAEMETPGPRGEGELPPGPWVRITSAMDLLGVPGPDSGLWHVKQTFFAECHGPLPLDFLERVGRYQAGAVGARELLERTSRDTRLWAHSHGGLQESGEDGQDRGGGGLQGQVGGGPEELYVGQGGGGFSFGAVPENQMPFEGEASEMSRSEDPCDFDDVEFGLEDLDLTFEGGEAEDEDVEDEVIRGLQFEESTLGINVEERDPGDNIPIQLKDTKARI